MNPHFKLTVICDDDVIAAELSDILQEAQSCAGMAKMQPSDWNKLEQKHVSLWLKEKEEVLGEAKNISTFKIEGLTNNFRNRERSLNQKILDTTSESLRRMYNSELEKALEKYESKVESIKKQVSQTDVHTTLIANGILEVMN